MEETLDPGSIVGRFVVIRDRNGGRIALSKVAVQAIYCSESGEGFLLLPGGRSLPTDISFGVLVRWFS
jgi:hypothetical protein